MPLPAPLRPFVRTRRFWTDFFWQTNAEEEYPECSIEFILTDGSGLTLCIDEGLSSFSLGLMTPGRESVEIAWDDQAHWHPHVLRWCELEIFCRALALRDPEFAHPGLPLLLLQRFTPICKADDADIAVPMLETAWRQLGLFTEAEIAEFIEPIDARNSGFRWHRREDIGGWILEQDEARRHGEKPLYTLRCAENKEFPFASLNRLFAESESVLTEYKGGGSAQVRAFANSGDMTLVPGIRASLRAEGRAAAANALGDEPPPARTCWIAETLLGSEIGSLVKRHVRRECEPRTRHNLDLKIPLLDRTRPLPDAAGKYLSDSLNGILGQLHSGSADAWGGIGTRAADGTVITEYEMFSIRLKGELTEGLRIIGDALCWVGAPESIRLTRARSETLSVPNARRTNPMNGGCLQIAALSTQRWNGAHRLCWQLDRIPLTRNCDTMRTILARAAATGPDESGWYQVGFTDGGSLRLCLGRRDEEAELQGATVVIGTLSLGAAELIHNLLTQTKLLLLPMGIATSRAVADAVGAPWPVIRVVDSPAALHDILVRGPHDWWASAQSAQPPPPA